MKRAAALRPAGSGVAWLLWALCAPAAATATATPAPAVAPLPVPIQLAQGPDYCAALARAAWPRTAEARRALLHRLEIIRGQCIGHAGYLAALGALWLEQGEPAQALLWLERALMLEPDRLGAQADHALALAALGEPAARDALIEQWQGRTDIPQALRLRLQAEVAAATHAAAAPGAAASSSGVTAVMPPHPNTVDGWVQYREFSLLGGYESNLDHSPRLSEITLTLPEGPVDAPLTEPIRPRRGAALLGDVSWQVAHSPRPGMVLQSGIQAGARHAPEHEGTDWQHVQWAGNASQQWGLWRAQLNAGASWVGGRDNESYHLVRLGLALDREAIGCNHRLALESENRHHEASSRADGRTIGGLISTQCPWPGSNGSAAAWHWGVAARHSLDQPIDPQRVGGNQRHSSLGLRLTGSLGQRTRLEASLRTSLLEDSEGYSPLLENNAVRVLHQTHLSIEVSRPLQWATLPGAEAVLQFQAVRQSSNLAIFRYHGASAYTGLRWRW